MASYMSEKVRKELKDAFNKQIDRSYHLSNMKDEFAKEWIVELQAEIKNLENDKRKILSAAGDSAFNPFIY